VASDGSGGGEDLLGLLGRWSAGQRQRQASASRVRERRLRQVEAESATLAGVLVNLAESGAMVAVMVAGRRFAGRVLAVGADFAALQQRSHSTLVRTCAVSSLSPVSPVSPVEDGGGGMAGVAGGDRQAALDMDFGAALAQLAGELMPARLWLPGGEVVEGQLAAAGTDVLTLRTANRRYSYVSLPRVTACSLV
jgi:hypothetical protein